VTTHGVLPEGTGSALVEVATPLALAGNMVGGILFVTLTRFGQAVGSSSRSA
jgi:hypothetical protein